MTYIASGAVLWYDLASAVFMVLDVLALGALVCRLGAMSWRTHQPSVVGMHAGLALGCAWSMRDALTGQVLDPGNIGILLSALCWLAVSWRTWVQGKPPPYAELARGETQP